MQLSYEHGMVRISEGSQLTLPAISFPEPEVSSCMLYADPGALCWIPAKDLEDGLPAHLEPIVLSATTDLPWEPRMIAGRMDVQNLPTLFDASRPDLSNLARSEEVHVLTARMVEPVRVYWRVR